MTSRTALKIIARPDRYSEGRVMYARHLLDTRTRRYLPWFLTVADLTPGERAEELAAWGMPGLAFDLLMQTAMGEW